MAGDMKVLFYPDPPVQLPHHTLSKTIQYFQLIGYTFTNDINDNWDIAVHWTRLDEDKVRCVVPEELLYDRRTVLNLHLNDISKSYVDKVFTKIFGYSSLADTTRFGYCVKKSERQGVHDGEIIKTPCEKEEDYVYQKLIDNRIGINMVCDIRFPVILGQIPLVFLKSKSIEGTFEHTKSSKKDYWVDKTENWVTNDEMTKIKEFCNIYSIDIGEVDTLRDNSTGRLYIIDVNSTPGGNVFKHLKNGNKVRDRLVKVLQSEINKL